MSKHLTAQDLRELLEAALDPRVPELDRRNAAYLLREHVADALDGATEGGDAIERP